MDEVLARAVHEFKGGEDFGELRFGGAEEVLYVVEGVEAEEGDVYGGGPLGADYRDAGYYSYGAFAADEELFEVVACVVFAEGAEVVYYCAVGQDCF